MKRLTSVSLFLRMLIFSRSGNMSVSFIMHLPAFIVKKATEFDKHKNVNNTQNSLIKM